MQKRINPDSVAGVVVDADICHLFVDLPVLNASTYKSHSGSFPLLDVSSIENTWTIKIRRSSFQRHEK